MGPMNTMFLVIFLALITYKALAAQLVVGGSQGWDQSTDFKSWASAQKFKVGDQLVFKYTSGLHSVVELPNESAYKNCDLGSALDTKSGGNNMVKLTKTGTRYFACGTLGHCNQGMKVKITTATGNAASSPGASPSDASPTSTTSSTSAASASLRSVTSFIVLAALSALLLSMF